MNAAAPFPSVGSLIHPFLIPHQKTGRRLLRHWRQTPQDNHRRYPMHKDNPQPQRPSLATLLAMLSRPGMRQTDLKKAVVAASIALSGKGTA